MVLQCPLLALRGHSRARDQCPLSGVKRTCLFALQMSANDPKRTFAVYLTPSRATVRIATMSCLNLGGDNEATRILERVSELRNVAPPEVTIRGR